MTIETAQTEGFNDPGTPIVSPDHSADNQLALSRVMDKLQIAALPEASLLDALDVCRKSLDATCAALLRRTDSGNMVTLMAAQAEDDIHVAPRVWPGVADFLSRPQRLDDIAASTFATTLPKELAASLSLLSVPVAVQEGPALALVVLAARKGAFSRADGLFVEKIAQLQSRTLARIRSANRTAQSHWQVTSAGSCPLCVPSSAPRHPDSRSLDWYRQIIDLTNEILGMPDCDVDAMIQRTLGRIGELVGVDRTYVYRIRRGDRLENTHEWTAPGVPQVKHVSQNLPVSLLDPWRAQMDAGLPVSIDNADEQCPDAPARAIMQGNGVQSLLVAPMLRMGQLSGLVGYDSTFRTGSFDPLEVSLLQSVANAISVVLDRADAEAAAAQAQATLMAKKDRLGAMLSAFPDMVVEMDGEGRSVGYNGGGEESHYLAPDQFIGKMVEDLAPPNIARTYRQLMQAVTADGKRRTFEYQAPVNDVLRWRHAVISPRKVDGKNDGWFVVIRDITEKREQQRQIARLSKIAALTSNMVIVTDAEARIEWVNPAFERRTGWRLEDIRGRKPASFLRSTRNQRLTGVRIDAAMRNHTPTQMELVNTTRSGEEYWVSMDLQPMLTDTGEIDGFVSVQTDITRMKNTHSRELRDWRLAIQASNDGIAMLNAEGQFIFMNHAYRDLFGIGDAEEAKDLRWGQLYPMETSDWFETGAWGRMISGGAFRFELRGKHRDGRVLRQELSAAARADGGLLVITRDVSDRIKAEQEKALLREQLQIAQSRELIAHVAAGAAHDLNNVFAVVSGTATLLKDICKGQDEALAGIERIQRAAQMAMELTASLTDLGRSEIIPARHDLRNLVRQGVDLLGSARVETHGVTVTVPAEKQLVWADSTRILQVIVNLLLNACESDPDQPAHVAVTVRPRDEGLPARAPDVGTVVPGCRYGVFTVTDTGIGISPALQRRLFEPYFTTKGKDGTGLGLPIVSSILRQGNAALWVDSTPGRGTTATVAWPEAATSDRVTPPIRPGHAGMAAHLQNGAVLDGHNILVVDDVADVADVIAETLQAWGAVVVSLSDPEQARTLLTDHPGFWSALVTDLNMPQLNGADLARIARSLVPPVPSVLVTARIEGVKFCDDLFAAILRKPTGTDELVAAVHRAITGQATDTDDAADPDGVTIVSPKDEDTAPA